MKFCLLKVKKEKKSIRPIPVIHSNYMALISSSIKFNSKILFTTAFIVRRIPKLPDWRI